MTRQELQSGTWMVKLSQQPPPIRIHRPSNSEISMRNRWQFFLDVANIFKRMKLNTEFIYYGSLYYNSSKSDDIDTLMVVPDKLSPTKIKRLVNSISSLLSDSYDSEHLSEIIAELGNEYQTYPFDLRRDGIKMSVNIIKEESLKQLVSAACVSARRRFKANISNDNPKPFLVSDVKGVKHDIFPRVDPKKQTVATPGSLKINNIPTIPHIFEYLLLTSTTFSDKSKPILPIIKAQCWRTLVRSVVFYNGWYEKGMKVLNQAFYFDPVTLFIRGNDFSEQTKEQIRETYRLELTKISLKIHF